LKHATNHIQQRCKTLPKNAEIQINKLERMDF
jgi:hypothetical protein